MSKKDFFHSTPNDILIFIEEHDKNLRIKAEIENENLKFTAWLTGLYVKSAIVSSLSKKANYPDSPITNDKINTSKVIDIDENSTLEERIAAEENVFASLELMQTQYEHLDR